MPTTFNNFRFSLHFSGKLISSLPLPTIALLLLFSSAVLAQSESEFTRVFRPGFEYSRLLDLKVQPDSSLWFTTVSDGSGGGSIVLSKISSAGQLLDQQYITSGAPNTFRIIPVSTGYMTYGALYGCDVVPGPAVSSYDSTGNLLWEVAYQDLFFEHDDSIFVLPLPDGSCWVFNPGYGVFHVNESGIVGTAPHSESVYNDYLLLSDDRYLVWGAPGLARYDTSMTDRIFALTGQKVLDAAVLTGGRVAALGKDSIWVLDENFEILKRTKIPAPGCIGLETEADHLYILYTGLVTTDLYQLDTNLEIIQTTTVTNTGGLHAQKFVCHNNRLYFGGSNSQAVLGLRGSPLPTPAYIPRSDAGIESIIAPNPITIPSNGNFELTNVSIVLKNEGADTLKKVVLNSVLSSFSFICEQTTFLYKQISDLVIPPGALDTIDLQPLTWWSPLPPSATHQLCFWTTSPNDRFCGNYPIVTGTHDLLTEARLIITPNPAHQTATLTLPSSLQLPADIRLFDASGRNIRQFQTNTANVMLQKDNLLPGFYQIIVADKKGQVSLGKIVFD